jgi:hypothetical protein
MAKDRFNRFKPINWDPSFKQTGSFLPKDQKPKKQLRTFEQSEKLIRIRKTFGSYMTDWELNFLDSIISVPYQLSEKQREVLMKIKDKMKLIYLQQEG